MVESVFSRYRKGDVKLKINCLFKSMLTICTILFLTASLSFTAGAAADLPEKNTKPRHQVCTALSEAAQAYYSEDYSYEKLCTLSGAEDVSTSLSATKNNELYGALYHLMSETHTYYVTYSGYKPGALAYYWASTDAVESSDSYVMFYSDMMAGEGVTMNREHIWPKSRASFYQKNGGSDLHHLRPSVESVNLAKSDHAFGDIEGIYSEGYKEGFIGDTLLYYVNKNQDLFECKDDVKGDVARILLYVYCRWQQPNLYTDLVESLPQPDPDDKANNGKKVIESLETLLRWCKSDPVDTWEMERNDLVEQIQGNRNVFIDYPEFAWQLFSQQVPEDMATPTHTGGGSGELPTETVEVLLGDADADSRVTVLDATCIQKTLASFTVKVFDRAAADSDQDGVITVLDATSIQKCLAHLPANPKIGVLIHIP